MNTDPAATGDAPARHSLGRTIAAVPDPGPLRPGTDRAGSDRSTTARSEAEGIPGAWFAIVLRGYDRTQVDARLAELDRRIRDEILRADTAEAALSTARAHVRQLQSSVTTPGSEDRGFGQRVERVLAAAEREAAELRERASAEATELVEKARGDADRARRQTEEALLGRAAKLDDEFTARSAALDAREQEVDRIVERARSEAEEIRAEARRAAAEESAAAERRAADLLAQAERTIEQQRADATRDIGRMTALRDEVRAELGRLQGLLRGELGDESGSGRTDLDRELSSDIAAGLDSDPGGVAGRRGSGSDDDVSTAIGTIPPLPATAVDILPFGDRSTGGPANGRSFAFELVPGMRSEQEPDEHGAGESDTSRTSDDATGRTPVVNRTPTRSTLPSRGRR